MIPKKIILFSIFVLFGASLAQAQSPDDNQSHFQEMFTLPEQDIKVPTVVEVELPDLSGKKKQFWVTQTATGESEAALFAQTSSIAPVKQTVKINGVVKTSLTDELSKTSETFPLPAVGSGLVELYVEGAEAFTASSLVFDLAPNVALPIAVTIKAIEDDKEVTIYARTKTLGTQIRFPQTTAKQWYVALEYVQPLRLQELRFVQDGVAATTKNTLRWLAQPETAYTVYTNPERLVSIQTPEAGDLKSDKDILVVSEKIDLQPNESFQLADSDGDGIPDQLDNCVQIHNPEQLDINNNGRGDVCDDFDKDGIINSLDNCVDKPNRSQADEDGDGIGDACDEDESRLTEKYFWLPWVAMGGAVLVFIGLFWIMINRVRAEQLETTNKEAMKPPQSDNSL